MGSTLPTTMPPVRVAEEYAILDCLSDGRVIAGFPLGTPMDANFCYGIPPLEQRERFREAHDLIVRAWTSERPFAFNGKYSQLPIVNVWPRPVQKPHPPIWIPGVGSVSTWEFVAERGYAYSMIAGLGGQTGTSVAIESGKRFWDFMDKRGVAYNPHRLGLVQLAAVAETDAEAERLYAPHVEYFQHKCTKVAPEFAAVPGYQDYASLLNFLKLTGTAQYSGHAQVATTYREFAERQVVIAGGWRSVVDQIEELARKVGFSHMMTVLQFGSMPHEVALYNTDLSCKKVIPALRHVFEGEYENNWWPKRLLQAPAPGQAMAAAVPASGGT
jgi:alkanesulfonate monooxygenase SsuD/methylene tetrahydromethanopterin reductase-like flavin-dependent oxidoreductase (luciferase family)